MKAHAIACLAAFERLCESPSARERRCMAKALKVAFDNIRGRDGTSVRPQELAYTLDTEDFIGLTNGVFDVMNNVFFPIGSVPPGVRVGMCTNYAYVGPDDPLYPEMRAEISEFSAHGAR